jgi:hypothetical protein
VNIYHFQKFPLLILQTFHHNLQNFPFKQKTGSNSRVNCFKNDPNVKRVKSNEEKKKAREGQKTRNFRG